MCAFKRLAAAAALAVFSCACVYADMTEILSTRQAVVFGKSNDVTVVALVPSRTSAEFEAYEEVSNTWRDGGVAFGVAVDPDSALKDRYSVEHLPSVVLFRAFDANGAARRGRKQEVRFTGKTFDFESLAAFVLSNGVPAVVHYPSNDGPDYTARSMAALQSPWPRLSVMGSRSLLNGVLNVLGPVCAAVKAKLPNFYCAMFTADPDGDAGQTQSLANMMGIDADDYDGDLVAAVVAPGASPASFDDAHSVLTSAAERFATAEDEEEEVRLDNFPDLTALAEFSLDAAAKAISVPLPRSPKSSGSRKTATSDDAGKKKGKKKRGKKRKIKSNSKNNKDEL